MSSKVRIDGLPVLRSGLRMYICASAFSYNLDLKTEITTKTVKFYFFLY